MEGYVIVIAVVCLTNLLVILALLHKKTPKGKELLTVKRGYFSITKYENPEYVYMITRRTRRGEEILAVYPIINNKVSADLMAEIRQLTVEGKEFTLK